MRDVNCCELTADSHRETPRGGRYNVQKPVGVQITRGERVDTADRIRNHVLPATHHALLSEGLRSCTQGGMGMDL